MRRPRTGEAPLALLPTLPLLFSLACGPVAKRPALSVPDLPPLPAVEWYAGEDGGLCVDRENAVRLRQREEIRAMREAALIAAIRAIGEEPSR